MELYSYVPPLGENIPISVEPFPVENLVPTEDKIEGAVKRLRNHSSGGTSGMWDEHLKGWLSASRKKEKEEEEAGEETTESNKGGGATEAASTEASNWAVVMKLVQTAFREGRLA